MLQQLVVIRVVPQAVRCRDQHVARQHVQAVQVRVLSSVWARILVRAAMLCRVEGCVCVFCSEYEQMKINFIPVVQLCQAFT